MIDLDTVRKIDSQKMSAVYDEWPQIAKKWYEVKFNVVPKKFGDHLIFTGMGGSGSIGDIFSAIFSKTDIHVDVVKGYLLPKTVNKDSYLIATSISGNTLETLNTIKMAKEIGCNIIAFSDGGKISQYCKDNNIEHVSITMQHSPRTSLVAFLYGMFKIFATQLPLDKNQVLESITELEKLNKVISLSNLSKTNTALELAEWMPQIPLIYYPAGLQAAAIRFKNSVQENAKMHVIAEDVIESCHNGIVSWVKPSIIKPILIRGTDDFTKTKERWEIVKEFFKENKIEYKEIFTPTGNIISKLVYLIYLFDFSSIYKAIISGVDPTPIEPIKYIKNRL